MKNKSVRDCALRDIAKYMKDKNIQVLPDSNGDVYVVTARYLNKNKEVTRLNRKLKIHAINKQNS